MARASANGDEAKTLDGPILARVLGGYREVLETRRDHINAINVFPVSDADTGSNLFHTVAGLADAAAVDDASLSEVAAALTDRALLAGRGASGLILSQAFAGLCSRLGEVPVAGGSELAGALEAAGRFAYEAVVDPVEGTMLTAAREAGTAAVGTAASGGDALAVATAARDAAWRSVVESPVLLPALANAGVVDSGAVGYALFLDVLQSHLDGEAMPDRDLPPGPASSRAEPPVDRFEIITELTDVVDVGRLREHLSRIGSTVAVAARGREANVHVHCREPQAALGATSAAGTVVRIEVTDLHAQADARREGGTILIGSDVADAVELLSAGADRILAPFDAGRLMQGIEAIATGTVRVVAVGETAAAARATAELTSADVEVMEVETTSDAVGALR